MVNVFDYIDNIQNDYLTTGWPRKNLTQNFSKCCFNIDGHSKKVPNRIKKKSYGDLA